MEVLSPGFENYGLFSILPTYHVV